MFAVIELQGHQYIVREGDEIVVDLLELESSTYVCDNVLLVAEEEWGKTQVGNPTVDGMVITFDVVTDAQKGEKIRVTKFKRKNRYQRIIWFRPHQTVLKVVSIGAGTKEKKVTKAAKIADDTPSTDDKPAKPAKVAKEKVTTDKPAKKVADKPAAKKPVKKTTSKE